MLDISLARKALWELTPPVLCASREEEKNREACQILEAFIDDVDHLLMHNNVKQVAALFKPPKKGT